MKQILFVVLGLTAANLQESDLVEVTIGGVAEFNLIDPVNSPLGNIAAGDAVQMSFIVDSDQFVDNPNFPTRGYPIDEATFEFALGAETLLLEDPFPAGRTPWFVIRDNDPAVDGFFVSDSPNFPDGVPTNEMGAFGAFKANFAVSYEGSTLVSLDVLDAVGSYDFNGLQSFDYTLRDGPVDAIGMLFGGMTLRVVPEPTLLGPMWLAVTCLTLASRRR